MFLIFKPPQSYLQVQLLDPDGFKKKYDSYEIQVAAKILEERQGKRKKRASSLELKKKIKEQLEAGSTLIEIADELSSELVAQEPAFEFTPEMKVDVDRIMAEYKTQVASETRQMVLDFIAEMQMLERQAAALEQQRLREADDYYRYQQEEKRRKTLKLKRMKILLLLASLDDDE